MNDIAIAGAAMNSCRFRSDEKPLRDLMEIAVTEACLSGLCEICLYQGTAQCIIFGQDRGMRRHPGARRSQKNKSGAM